MKAQANLKYQYFKCLKVGDYFLDARCSCLCVKRPYEKTKDGNRGIFTIARTCKECQGSYYDNLEHCRFHIKDNLLVVPLIKKSKVRGKSK